MKKTIISASTLAVGGLVTAGLLALPVAGVAQADEGVKRDEGTTEIVLVDEDDDLDDDRDDLDGARDVTRDAPTQPTQVTQVTRQTRDQGGAGQERDWTTDAATAPTRDWTAADDDDADGTDDDADDDDADDDASDDDRTRDVTR